MSLLFISDAMAATGQAAEPMGGAYSSILMLAGFVLIFYFLLWRPQSKRAKEQRDLISQLQKEDEVITAGGIAGKINKVTDDFVEISVAEGVSIKVQKQAIMTSLPKGTLKTI